ncbi:SDR family NAD(P)-dependent oxidoreductase [Kitasatospora sp. NPDC098663]|uniref:SDR family NAD(P)-dependent oxidoreductase n=1 Tax=Kitasatospora sp. NPDC098663 TaxID=3364096 RepID=UPI00382F1AF5
MTPIPEDAIAVVGMAARVPGADSVQELWDNVLAHQSSVTRSTDGSHLYARGHLDTDVALFDPAFFGMSPREALTCDPQQRLLLECAWQALADADAGRPQNTPVRERTAVFCSTNHSGYRDLLARSGPISALEFEAGTAQDFAATRLAYRLGLRGPCVAVQTACSSSLVAVHLACQALLLREADQALAGGASIVLPHSPGWQYESASIHSASGVCRPFDAAADGTVMGDGAALVALRRLEDAVADGSRIYAVIRGSAVTNDGGRSNGFTAPSGSGQAEVIRAALARAGLDGGQIGYVETHGTGTALGDQVELQALADVFASRSDPGGVTLGSAKGAIGHLDIAAGVIGLIRASLAVHHAVLPSTVNHTTPAPALASGAAPLRVLTRPQPWAPTEGVRRAGVSSFGVGGTNAHVVLEEPPPSDTAAGPRSATLRDAGYRPRRIWPEPGTGTGTGTTASIGTAEPAGAQVEFRRSNWTQWSGHRGAEAPRWARVVLMAEQDHTGRRLFDLLAGAVPEGTPVVWAPDGLVEAPQGRVLVVCGYALGAGSQPARRAYDALASLVASTAAWPSACGVDVVALTRRAHPVLGTEGGDPRAATLTGLARALSMDVPAVRIRTLDLDGTQPWALAEAVRRSVDWAAEPVLALRGRRWWSPTYTPVPEPEPEAGGGVSVVVGVGQIGAAAARVLAATGGTLVLAARPGPGLRNAQRLADDFAAQPARIVVRECDATDPRALTALIARVTRDLGRIERIVMAAGISGQAAYQDSTRLPQWDDEQHFVLKIDAAATLRAAAASHHVRRVVLMSSLAGVLGAIGLSAYSAASAATDSHALHAEYAHTRWLSIGWDAWQHHDATASAHEQRMVQDGLTPWEAEQALTRLLLSDQSGHVLVVKGAFEDRYERYVRAPLSTAHSPELLALADRPQADLLATLLDAWRSCLADPDLGPDDDLTAHGADSLTAIDVLARVGAQTGRVLPTELYFAASSVRDLVAAIESTTAAGQPPHPAAVRSWGEGGRSTLWCMHPISGSADAFAALAAHLGDSHQVHALPGPPLSDVTGEISIEDLALHHHQQLTASVPRPDVVLGFSFGSHLALAVAQQVYDTTGHAPTVVVLDMPAPSGPGPRSITRVPAAEIVAAITSHRARETGRRLVVDPYNLRHDPPEQAMADLLDDLRAQQVVPESFTTEVAARLASGYRHRLAAAERFRPRPYPGRIVVVRAAENEYDDSLLAGVLPAPCDDSSWGWAALAQQGHAVYVLDAHHTTLLQHPSVAGIVHQNAPRPEGPST